jgi:hypothetical protein
MTQKNKFKKEETNGWQKFFTIFGGITFRYVFFDAATWSGTSVAALVL